MFKKIQILTMTMMVVMSLVTNDIVTVIMCSMVTVINVIGCMVSILAFNMSVNQSIHSVIPVTVVMRN